MVEVAEAVGEREVTIVYNVTDGRPSKYLIKQDAAKEKKKQAR